MTNWPEHVAAVTTHARRGALRNAFRYRLDYLLIDPESDAGPRLFSRNRANLAAVHDRDHGGPRGGGRGIDWAREVLAARGFAPGPGRRIRLLTQPRLFGIGFNPVSFWLATEGEALCAVIAEVNNTFGDRHNYLVHNPGFAPIGPADRLAAEKLMHVSPFQDLAGRYHFAFDLDRDRIAIRIHYGDGAEGLIATLVGRRQPLGNVALIAAALVRPWGPARTWALIHWQALRLWRRGGRYHPRPAAPERELG